MKPKPVSLKLAKALVVVAFILPVSALADITNANATLSVGQTLSLDTGAISSSGAGDITFTGTSITFVGSAAGGVIPGTAGQKGYSAITLVILQDLAGDASASPIAVSSLSAGNTLGSIIGMGTNGGNAAKLLVTALSANSIGFEYTTFGTTGGGGGGGQNGPTITGVVNNYSFVPAGFPNSGVAPSSIFTIFGTGMAAASNPQTLNTSAAPGIPTTFNGTSVSVTVGATTLPVGLYYALPVQIAGVLPHATPTGAGTITVTYNGTASNQFAIQVIPSGVGLDTYFGSGNGLITMTDAHTAVLHDYTNSAATGEKVTLWGTGLGSDPSDS
ncbi:MAG: hypothetical protein ABSB86_16095, partial [Bryobacteraceae bacterium]